MKTYPNTYGYSCRPSSMYNVDNLYYPEGKPRENENIYEQIAFLDENGVEFKIVYTEKQFHNHLKNNFGVFCPYIPLYVTNFC